MNADLKLKLPENGTLALVGSGEYLPGMDVVDIYLLSLLPIPAKVICLPTAAGLEGDNRVQYWMDLGVDHFTRLGALAKGLPVFDRTTAMDQMMADEVADANFIYLSGGKPDYLYYSLKDTLLWDAIISVFIKGGVLAGCSAGAMIFGAKLPLLRKAKIYEGGFGWLPDAFIMPHFDEFPGLLKKSAQWLAGGSMLVGIPAYTALICNGITWKTVGRGSVLLGG